MGVTVQSLLRSTVAAVLLLRSTILLLRGTVLLSEATAKAVLLAQTGAAKATKTATEAATDTTETAATSKEANRASLLGLLLLVATVAAILLTVCLLATESTGELGTESTALLLTAEAASDEAQVHRLKEAVVVNVRSLASGSAGLVLHGGRSVVVGHGLVVSVGELSLVLGGVVQSIVDRVRNSLVLCGFIDSRGLSTDFGGFGGRGLNCGGGLRLLRVEGSAVDVCGHDGQDCE